MEAQLGKPPILPITAKLYFTNSFSLLLQTRMVLHTIYQLPLGGGYHPLAGMLLALAPPKLPYMFLFDFQILLCLLTLLLVFLPWSMSYLLLRRSGLQRRLTIKSSFCLNIHHHTFSIITSFQFCLSCPFIKPSHKFIVSFLNILCLCLIKIK